MVFRPRSSDRGLFCIWLRFIYFLFWVGMLENFWYNHFNYIVQKEGDIP